MSNRRRRRIEEDEEDVEPTPVSIPRNRRPSRTNASFRVNTSTNEPPIPANIDYTWGNWSHVEDNEDHLIKKSLDPNWELAKNYIFKGSPKEPFQFYTGLKNARVKACIDATKWHHMLAVKEFRHDQKCVLSLLERWWDTTHTFHLPNVELGFSPYDFTCITGIPIARGNTVPFDQGLWAEERKLRSMFPDITGDDVLGGSGIRCRYLKEYLSGIRLPVCTNAARRPSLAESQLETK